MNSIKDHHYDLKGGKAADRLAEKSKFSKIWRASAIRLVIQTSSPNPLDAEESRLFMIAMTRAIVFAGKEGPR